MNKSLYIIAGLLIIVCAIMYYGFDLFLRHSYSVVHVFLAIAIILLLYKVIKVMKATSK